MRRHITRLLAGVVALALCMLPGPALARASAGKVSAQIPVEVSVSEGAPAQEFAVTIEPAEGETLQPDTDRVVVDGAGKVTLGVTLDQVGEHHYVVRQEASAAEHWTLDATTYDVTVRCVWNDATETLGTEVYVRDADGFKSEGCRFANAYAKPSTPATKTPSSQRLAQTGDTTPLATIAALAVVGCVAVVAGVVPRRREDRE